MTNDYRKTEENCNVEEIRKIVRDNPSPSGFKINNCRKVKVDVSTMNYFLPTDYRMAKYDRKAVVYRPVTKVQRAIIDSQDIEYQEVIHYLLATSDTMADYIPQVEYIFRSFDYQPLCSRFIVELIPSGSEAVVDILDDSCCVTVDDEIVAEMQFDNLKLTSYFNLIKHCRLITIDETFDRTAALELVDYIWLNSYFQRLINCELGEDRRLVKNLKPVNNYWTSGYTLSVVDEEFEYDSRFDDSCMYNYDSMTDYYDFNDYRS